MRAKQRLATILASESIATAGTKIIEIKEKEPISSFSLRFKGTNSDSTPLGHPAAMIKTVEVKSGSDILYSLTGFEAQALNFYEKGYIPFNVLEYEDNIECCAAMDINFGRYSWDKELALDPSKFPSGIQLSVVHDKALGGSTCDAGTLMIHANVFDGGSARPIGFLQAREHQAYSLTASAAKPIDLPTDLALRRVMLQSRNTTQNATDQFSKVKLKVNNGEQVIIPETNCSELLKIQNPNVYVSEKFAGLGTASAVSYFITPTYEAETVGVGRSATQTAEIFAQPAGGKAAVTNDASESFSGFVLGLAPHGGIDLPFGDQLDMNDWLNLSPNDSLGLDITAGGSGSGTNRIVTQQLRRY